MPVEIGEIGTDEGFREAWAVMSQLRTSRSEDQYLELLAPMRREGYRLIAARVDGRIVALAGIILLTNLYDGRHVYVYDLITDGAMRSHGFGGRLLAWVEDFARDQGCEKVSLSSGVQRIDAHRFY